MISNSLLIELLAKERQQVFEQEAKMIQLSKLAQANKRNQKMMGVEKFANLLISVGEYIK